MKRLGMGLGPCVRVRNGARSVCAKTWNGARTLCVGQEWGQVCVQGLGMGLGPCVRVGNGARSVCEDLEWG